jgi:hypothetical protein
MASHLAGDDTGPPKRTDLAIAVVASRDADIVDNCAVAHISVRSYAVRPDGLFVEVARLK